MKYTTPGMVLMELEIESSVMAASGSDGTYYYSTNPTMGWGDGNEQSF